MITDKKIANAMSGKTARACDCCIRKRARWYCAADDAFLCQTCDKSVHSANPLAYRHERVRLETASLKPSNQHPVILPSWHRGSTRKARTPRHGKSTHQGSKSEVESNPNPLPTVPELGSESSQDDEGEDQLVYRVPILDPFTVAELCSSTTTSSVKGEAIKDGYIASDLDLDEFAADVETLLGKGLDDEESYGIEQLGLLNSGTLITTTNHNHNSKSILMDFFKPVKAEDSDDMATREPFEFSFDYDYHEFPTTCEDQEDHKLDLVELTMGSGTGDHHHHHHHHQQQQQEIAANNLEGDNDEVTKNNEEMIKGRRILLRLDYKAISEAWASNGSPWMNGQRPQLNPDDCWPHCMGTCGAEIQHEHKLIYGENQMGGIIGGGQIGVISDGGREARVSRYREKRRTRLFAKKIRYEVRKLNAEKRPRMKGRFVKRSSFPSSAPPFPLLSK